MNYLDIIIAIPLVWGAYKGFRKGFIIEIASLIALLLGILGGLNFSSYVADFLSKTFVISTKLMPLLSFVLTFIIIVIIVFFIAKMLERVVKIAALGVVNRLAGMVFGVTKFGVIISVMLNIVNTVDAEISFVGNEVKTSSILYKPLSDFSSTLFPQLNALKKSISSWKDDNFD